jgi:hypothetical protein
MSELGTETNGCRISVLPGLATGPRESPVLLLSVASSLVFLEDEVALARARSLWGIIEAQNACHLQSLRTSWPTRVAVGLCYAVNLDACGNLLDAPLRTIGAPRGTRAASLE